MKCWLCNKDGFAPGEAKLDNEGDLTCMYCQQRIDAMAFLMANPAAIPITLAAIHSHRRAFEAGLMFSEGTDDADPN